MELWIHFLKVFSPSIHCFLSNQIGLIKEEVRQRK
jgi:hypothetical protein